MSKFSIKMLILAFLLGNSLNTVFAMYHSCPSVSKDQYDEAIKQFEALSSLNPLQSSLDSYSESYTTQEQRNIHLQIKDLLSNTEKSLPISIEKILINHLATTAHTANLAGDTYFAAETVSTGKNILNQIREFGGECALTLKEFGTRAAQNSLEFGADCGVALKAFVEQFTQESIDTLYNPVNTAKRIAVGQVEALKTCATALGNIVRIIAEHDEYNNDEAIIKDLYDPTRIQRREELARKHAEEFEQTYNNVATAAKTFIKLPAEAKGRLLGLFTFDYLVLKGTNKALNLALRNINIVPRFEEVLNTIDHHLPQSSLSFKVKEKIKSKVAENIDKIKKSAPIPPAPPGVSEDYWLSLITENNEIRPCTIEEGVAGIIAEKQGFLPGSPKKTYK